MQKQKELRRLVTVLLAACLMAVNIKTFVRAGGLYPGGATGLTILFQRMAETFLHWEVPYTLINVSLNAIPVYIGFRYIGKKFTLYSLLMIVEWRSVCAFRWMRQAEERILFRSICPRKEALIPLTSYWG